MTKIVLLLPETHPSCIFQFFFLRQPISTSPVRRTRACPEATQSCPKHVFHVERLNGTEDFVWIYIRLILKCSSERRRLCPVRSLIFHSILIVRVRILRVDIRELYTLAGYNVRSCINLRLRPSSHLTLQHLRRLRNVVFHWRARFGRGLQFGLGRWRRLRFGLGLVRWTCDGLCSRFEGLACAGG